MTNRRLNSNSWKKNQGRASLWQWLFYLFSLFCSLLTSLVMPCLLMVAVLGSYLFFQLSQTRFFEFFTSLSVSSEVDSPVEGVLPLVWGTVVIAFGACLVAVPLGLATAVYLGEIASFRIRRFLKPIQIIFGLIPSVVYGFVALNFVTPLLRQCMAYFDIKVEVFNAASAAIVAGIMITPMLSLLAEEVIRSLPQGLREAAYGLGATRFEVVTQVVLPAATPGLLACLLLAVSRAIGESMVVAIAAGNSSTFSTDVFSSVQSLAGWLVEQAKSPVRDLSLYVVCLILLFATLSLHFVSDLLLRRFRERWQ